MNYKLLFPTYRTRYLFLTQTLARLCEEGRCSQVLHLGTGEGDYDPLIRSYCERLVACDINRDDLEFARGLNAHIEGLEYRLEDVQDLTFGNDMFDVVVAIEVIEHVEDSPQMMAEIARVLKPGGVAVLSCPSRNFPFTYDPLNFFLRAFGRRLPVGAYSFGHWKLMEETRVEQWAEESGLKLLQARRLTGPLAALVELYWPGLMQKLLKANATNKEHRGSGGYKLRPSHAEPPLVFLTDLLIEWDRRLFSGWSSSVGLGFLFEKNSP